MPAGPEVLGRPFEDHEPGREDERAEGQRLAPEARGQRRPGDRAREVARAQDAEDRARVQWREAEPVLQIQGQHEEERGHARIEGEHDHEPDREGALAKERGSHERRSAPGLEAPGATPEDEQERDRGGEGGERPRGPVQRPALDEREDDRDEARGHERRTGEVQAAAARITRLGDQPRGERHRRDPDREVDEKAAAPGQAGDVGLDQRAADELPEEPAKPMARP